MQGIINKEIDYISEVCQLFSLLANEETLSDAENSLCQKHSQSASEIQQRFALPKQIEKEARGVFRRKKEEITFYFQREDEEECGLAYFVLLEEDGVAFQGKTTEQFKEKLEALSEKEYCEEFSSLLQRQGCSIYESDCEKDRTFVEVTKRILKMKLSDTKKVKLQDVLWNREEHRKRLLELIDRGVDFLHRFDGQIQEEIEFFISYWSNQFESISFSEYVKKNVQLNIDENIYGYEIWANIMGANRFSFTRKVEDDGTYNSKDEVHIGIVFCTGINPISTEKSEKEMETYVNEVLKALSDKSKFEILSYIKDKRAYGSELAKHMGLTTATISHHMSALFTCGLVELSKENNRIFYRENKKAVEEVLDYCRKVLLEE